MKVGYPQLAVLYLLACLLKWMCFVMFMFSYVVLLTTLWSYQMGRVLQSNKPKKKHLYYEIIHSYDDATFQKDLP